MSEGKVLKVRRLLEYEGTEEAIRASLTRRVVNGEHVFGEKITVRELGDPVNYLDIVLEQTKRGL